MLPLSLDEKKQDNTPEAERVVFPMNFHFLIPYVNEILPDLGGRETVSLYDQSRLDEFLEEIKLLQEIRHFLMSRGSVEKEIQRRREKKISLQRANNIIQLDKDLVRQFYIYDATTNPINGNKLLKIALGEEKSNVLNKKDALAILLAKNYVGKNMVQGGMIDTAFLVTQILGQNIRVVFQPEKLFYKIAGYNRIIMRDTVPAQPDEIKPNDIVIVRQNGNLVAYWNQDGKLYSKLHAASEVPAIPENFVVGGEITDQELIQAIAFKYGCPFSVAYEMQGKIINVDKLDDDLGNFQFKQKFIFDRLENGSYRLSLDEQHSELTVSKACWKVMLSKAHKYLNLLLSESDLLTPHEDMSKKYFELIPYLVDPSFRKDFLLVMKYLPTTEVQKIEAFIHKSYPDIVKTYLTEQVTIDEEAKKWAENKNLNGRKGKNIKNELAFLCFSLTKQLEEESQTQESQLYRTKQSLHNELDNILKSDMELTDDKQDEWINKLRALNAFEVCSSALTRLQIEENITLIVNKLQQRNKVLNHKIQDEKTTTEERLALLSEKNENNKQLAFYDDESNREKIITNFLSFKTLLDSEYQRLKEGECSSEILEVCVSFFDHIDDLVKHPADPIYIKAYDQWCVENVDNLREIGWLSKLKQGMEQIHSSQVVTIFRDFNAALENLSQVKNRKFHTMTDAIMARVLLATGKTSEMVYVTGLMRIAYNIYNLSLNKELDLFSEGCIRLFKPPFKFAVEPHIIAEKLNKIRGRMEYLARELNKDEYKNLLKIINKFQFRVKASLDDVITNFLDLITTYSQNPLPLPDDQDAFKQALELADLLSKIDDQKLSDEYKRYDKMLYHRDEFKGPASYVPPLNEKIILAKFLLNKKALQDKATVILNAKIDAINSKSIDELWTLDKDFDVLKASLPLSKDLLEECNVVRNDSMSEVRKKLDTDVLEPGFLSMKTGQETKGNAVRTYQENLKTILERQKRYLNQNELRDKDNELTKFTEKEMGILPDQTREQTMFEFTREDKVTDDGQFHFKGLNQLQQDATQKSTISPDFKQLTREQQEDALRATVTQLQHTIENTPETKVGGGSTLCATAVWIDENKEANERKLQVRGVNLGDSLSYVIIVDNITNEVVKNKSQRKSQRLNKVLHNERINDEKGKKLVDVNRSLGDDVLLGNCKPDNYHEGECFSAEIQLSPNESFYVVNVCDGFPLHLQGSNKIETSIEEELDLVSECVTKVVKENKDKENTVILRKLGFSMVETAYGRGSNDNISGVVTNEADFKPGEVKLLAIGDGHGVGGELVAKAAVENIKPTLNAEISNKVANVKKSTEVKNEQIKKAQESIDLASVLPLAPVPTPNLWNRTKTLVKNVLSKIPKPILFTLIFMGVMAAIIAAALIIAAIVYVSHGLAVPSVPSMVAAAGKTILGLVTLALEEPVAGFGIGFGIGFGMIFIPGALVAFDVWLSKNIFDRIINFISPKPTRPTVGVSEGGSAGPSTPSTRRVLTQRLSSSGPTEGTDRNRNEALPVLPSPLAPPSAPKNEARQNASSAPTSRPSVGNKD